MLVTKTVIFVEPLYIPFEYRRTIRPSGIYYKWYDIETIHELKLTETTNPRKFDILIKHGERYLFCPFLNNIYKDLKTQESKNSLLYSISVSKVKEQYYVSFISKRRKFNTPEVVQITNGRKSYTKNSIY